MHSSLASCQDSYLVVNGITHPSLTCVEPSRLGYNTSQCTALRPTTLSCPNAFLSASTCVPQRSVTVQQRYCHGIVTKGAMAATSSRCTPHQQVAHTSSLTFLKARLPSDANLLGTILSATISPVSSWMPSFTLCVVWIKQSERG